MIEAEIFIPLLIIAIVQALKEVLPIKGYITILVAFVVATVVAIVDVKIGVEDVTVAQSLVLALGAVGISTVASKIGNAVSTQKLVKK